MRKWNKADAGMRKFNGLALSCRNAADDGDIGIFCERYSYNGKRWAIRKRPDGDSWNFPYPFKTQKDAKEFVELSHW